MTDELEARLHDAFEGARLPSAPPSLSRLLTDLATEAAAEPVRPRRRPWVRWALITGVFAAVMAGSSSVVLLNAPIGATPVNETPRTTTSSSPASTPSPSHDALEGLRTYEVGELEAAMAGPGRPAGQFAVRGYWTDRSYGHSCAYIEHSETNLEIFCHDGEYGITQLNEPILTITADHQSVPASGPALTPWVPDGIDAQLLGLPIVNNQPYPPVPIIVIGHIDDPRASECAADRRQTCLDRLVIERLVSFDPSSVPTPAPTPVPTPFPYDNPPPAPFAAGDCPGETEYAFVGWKTMSEIGMWFPETGDQNDVVFVVITKHVIQVGDWIDDPEGSGRRFRTMGQRICFAHEWEVGGMSFTTVPGTTYREWDDGTRTPIEP